MSMAFLVDSQDAGPDAAGQVVHPLAPLNAAEIEAASAAVKKSKDLKDSARFVYISLYEPSKHDVIAFDGGTGLLPDRLVKVVIRERAERASCEVTSASPASSRASCSRSSWPPRTSSARTRAGRRPCASAVSRTLACA